jgi:predicted O-methyltransferase YrrM
MGSLAAETTSIAYYFLCLQLIRSGGIIAIDNMFYGGLVADSSCDDPNAVATRDLASFLIDDDRVNYALIPIGDGLAIACVK